ncbi:metal-dependent hydrolase [Natrinema halophilum]|uniref:Metal-dependent hydrolase n=1 Tax=Natrinema halophilum TaxID=1699371 RepID=A0A7D5GJJ5_9EURY|nr:metal-dependent hydrolase [Natrinema halophilum]QLG48470.1 metal-dependent hydrolase [Natrinema halophilum]
MVADGVHILLSLALVMITFRSRRPEPYFVTALAAAVPDIDVIVFHPLIDLGYVEGALWVHRGLTHSLVGGIVIVGLLSAFGPWRAAAIGFGSHIVLDFMTGGVRLLAPFDAALYGVSYDWMLMNLLTSTFAVTVLLSGMLVAKYEFRAQIPSNPPEPVLEWLQ